jgi:putative transposase
VLLWFLLIHDLEKDMEKQHIQLKKSEREYWEKLLEKGPLRAKLFKRAPALLELDRGKTLQAVAATVTVKRVSGMRWRDSYRRQALKSLEEAPRSGRPMQIQGTQRAKITALACREARQGYARWNRRRLAAKVVQLRYGDRLSHLQVGNVLKRRTAAPSPENLVPGAEQRSLPRS